MGQKGFWDEQERREKLNQKKPTLKWLNENINWQDFRPVLETIYDKERKSNAGRKPIDVILMFKLLILQQMYGLSDDELEFQVNDRISFMEFLGLGIEDRIPDAKTVWLFRQHLCEHKLVEEVFLRFDNYLRERGYRVETGQIVDATLVPVPTQRNTRQENKEVKAGKIPQKWQENHHILRQKDRDARWIKKNGIKFYGYKNHINIDVKYGFIRHYVVTDAAVHDSQVVSQLIDIDASEIWADSAYRSADLEWTLRKIGFTSNIHEKSYRNRPLTPEQTANNRSRSRVRAKVEHVFAQWVMRLGGKLMRSIGKARIEVGIGLKNLAYNFLRYAFWEQQPLTEY